MSALKKLLGGVGDVVTAPARYTYKAGKSVGKAAWEAGDAVVDTARLGAYNALGKGNTQTAQNLRKDIGQSASQTLQPARNVVKTTTSVAKSAIKPVWETADYAKDAVKLGAYNISGRGNTTQANNARFGMNQSFQQSVFPAPSRVVNSFDEIVNRTSTKRANQVGNVANELINAGFDKNEVEDWKIANQDSIYNNALNKAGFNKDMSKGRMFAQSFGDLASTAGLIISPTEGSKINGLKMAGRELATSAALNAVGGGASTYGQTGDIKEAAKSAGTNAVLGTALTAAGYATPYIKKGVGDAVSTVKNMDEGGFLNVSRSHPAVKELDGHLEMLNRQRSKLLADGISEMHPTVKANAEAYRRALIEKDRVVKSIKEGGYARVPTPKDPLANDAPQGKTPSKNPLYEVDKNPQFSQMADAARKAKSFEEFANGTYEVPIKNLHGNTPEAANTPGLSRTPNEPVDIYMRQGRPVIDVTDGNHRLYEAKARGDETIKVKFNDTTKKGGAVWGNLRDFYDEANGSAPQVGKILAKDPLEPQKQGATALDIQEVVDATRQYLESGDIDNARMLSESLPEKYRNALDDEISMLQNKYEQEILSAVEKDVNESLSADIENADVVMSRVAKKLAASINVPKGAYKFTGARRTYKTMSGELQVGGSLRSAVDSVFMAQDIDTFNKNISILAEKFGGTYKEIDNILKSAAPDGANYERFTNELSTLLSERPAYSRGNREVTQSIIAGQPKTTAKGQATFADNQAALSNVVNPYSQSNKIQNRLFADQRGYIQAPVPKQPISVEKRPVVDVQRNVDVAGEIRPPAIPGDVPQAQSQVKLPNTKTSKFISTIKSSDEVSPELRSAVSATYEVTNNKAQIANAQNYVSSFKDLSELATTTRTKFSEGSKPTSQDIVDSIAAAKMLDSSGRIAEASEIYDAIASHASKKGQEIQALATLTNRTPDGLRYKTQKDFKNSGVVVTPELQVKLDLALNDVRLKDTAKIRLANTVDKQIELRRAANLPVDDLLRLRNKVIEQHKMAVLKYSKLVGDNLPQSKVDKALSVWKAGLLTGVKTQTGNLLSNATFGVFHDLSSPLASAIDSVISLGTNKRTKTLTPRGKLSGGIEGMGRGYSYLKSGVDELGTVGNKFEQHGELNFKNKAARVYVNGVFRTMGAADKPFRYAQLKNSLYDIATAESKNRGLSGASKAQFVREFVLDPPKHALEIATNEAAKAVLGNDTYLSNLAGKIRNAAESVDNPVGKAVAKATTGVLLPFTKVPSAFVSRVIDFTPVGALKEIVSQVGKKKFDQRALSTALAEATTGTAIISLGYNLAKNDMLSGDMPLDEKEKARWQAEGIQPNSIKVGGKWLSLNYLGSTGSLFSQGKRVADVLKEGGSKGDALVSSTSGIAKDALNQSFLKGVSSSVDVIQDPKRYASNFINSQASSVVPTILKDVAESTDPMQRQVNNTGDALQAKIPGLRKGLLPKQDVYGNDLSRNASGISKLANPLRPSSSIDSEVLSEVRRLNTVGVKVTPTPVDKKVKFDKIEERLTPEQRYDLQKRIGQRVQNEWNKMITTPEYLSLSDEAKGKALDNLRSDIRALEERQFGADNALGANRIGSTAKPDNLTKRQRLLAINGVRPGVYTNEISGDGTSVATSYTPSETYRAKLDDYNQSLQDGTLTGAKKIQAENALRALKVKSGYDSDTVAAYSLPKEDLYNYLSSDPNGGNKWKALLDLDQKMAANGYSSKFFDKYGRVKSLKQPATKSRSKKSSKAKTRKAVKYKIPTVKNGYSNAALTSKTRALLKKARVS